MRPGRWRGISRRTLAVAGALAMQSAPASAQVPVTALGLGYPPAAVDGRAAALGGAAMGIEGGSLTGRNPADLVLFRRPALGVTFAPENVDVETPAGTNATGRSRLAVLQSVLPIGSWAFGFGVQQELDQDWTVLVSDTLESSMGTFPFEERREHDGGVSSVNFAAMRRLGPIALGAEFDVLTGSLRQTYRRNFESALEDPSRNIGFAAGEARWSFSGYRLRAGAALRVQRLATVSAAFSWTSDLDARRDTTGTAVPLRRFEMPLALEAGGSLRLSQRLLLAIGAGWKGWSGTDVSSLGFDAEDVWWLGGGVELSGLRLLGMTLPVRAGYRFADLPFHELGREQLRETAFTFGLGTAFAGERARVDLGVEIGKRGDLGRTGAEEGFSRFSISLALQQP